MPAWARSSCTNSSKEAERMMQDILKTSMFDAVWHEDNPQLGGAGYFELHAERGTIQVELFNGKHESYGRAPARFCSAKGRIVAELDRASLRFGAMADMVLNSRLQAAQGNTKVILIDIKPAGGGKVYIADRMTDHAISSTFSNVAK
jgi:hypothetical protein